MEEVGTQMLTKNQMNIKQKAVTGAREEKNTMLK